MKRKLNIEKQIKIALTKNPITRDRLIIKILTPSIEKCVGILLKNNRRAPRLHSLNDLIQEAKLTVLKVIQGSNFIKINCAIRTYILGAVKRKVWGLLREEFALKRHAQTKAYPLDVLESKYSTGNIDNSLRFKDEEASMIDILETKDLAEKIQAKLKSPALELFRDSLDGYSINEIAVRHNIPVQSIYTIMRRKVKPIAKRLLES